MTDGPAPVALAVSPLAPGAWQAARTVHGPRVGTLGPHRDIGSDQAALLLAAGE